jgi:predicted Zn-dependent protease
MKKNILCLLFSIVCLSSSCATEFNRYLERAKRKISEGKYPEAIESLKKAAIKEAENPEIYYLLSDCQKKVKDYAEAAKSYALAKALEGRKENVLLEGAVRLAKLF